MSSETPDILNATLEKFSGAGFIMDILPGHLQA